MGLTFVVGEGRIRVERDPALCGRFNEEVGYLSGVTEPRDKSCVSCILVHCICSCSSFSHHSVKELFISFWCVDFEKCPSQIYYFKPWDHLGHLICKVNWVNFVINSVLYLII